MYFERIFTPGLAINSFLIGDEKSKRCAVIDPTRHVTPFIVKAQNGGLEITDILETHVHADFVSGAKELKHQLNEKPLIYASGMGGEEWIPAYADVIVQQGLKIRIGDVRLEAMHTPGHTPEHVMWVCYDESRAPSVPWFAFTGDCLFVGSIGRPDLLGKKEMTLLAPQLYTSIFEVLAPLPDFLEIFPAHGEGSLCGKGLMGRTSSTLGYERRFNPYFKKQEAGTWIAHVEKELEPAPKYFAQVKALNVSGPPLLNSLNTSILQAIDSSVLDNLFLIDVRHPEIFATSHLAGSLNIPLSSSFAQWAGLMLPLKEPIGLVCEKTQIYAEVIATLRLMGFDQDMHVIQLDEPKLNLDKLDISFSHFQMIEPEALSNALQGSKPFYILDVRTARERQSGHIAGSHHIELNQLESKLDQLPKDNSIVLLCRGGQRASLGASLLQKHGFPSVLNLRGGMQAWKQAGLPLEPIQNL